MKEYDIFAPLERVGKALGYLAWLDTFDPERRREVERRRNALSGPRRVWQPLRRGRVILDDLQRHTHTPWVAPKLHGAIVSEHTLKNNARGD